ncbi:uncharacterized protein LOC130993838 [Salvia miltiorrhiza]|uniref:uncharacterized protein LOC130993838 n=1 Tax=Salvia miltiorrhiza TaxID=226208 RepID=UPI0025AC488E|nr:uncharacterized protein LOC130993838 [Salvia miltiorrhiza]
MVWNSKAPHKAIMTAWRVIRNRIPTYDNLRKRSVAIGEEDSKCNACKLHTESSNHFFLQCPKAEEVWNEIQLWMGISTARTNSIGEFLCTFVGLGSGKRLDKLMKSLWVCSIWTMWKRKNESRFEGKVWDSQSTVSEIKVRLWCWNKIFEIVNKELNLSSWCENNLLTALV